MIELYVFFHQNGILLFLFISLLAIIWQALYAFRISTRKLRQVFELSILLYISSISVMLRYMNTELSVSMLVLRYGVAFRWMCIGMVLLLGMILWMQKGSISVLYGMTLTGLTMPAFEKISDGGYAFLFYSFLILIASRAGAGYWLEIRRQKQEITEYSIKEALDAQHSGILFTEKNGTILLINQKMLSLMSSIFCEYMYNGEKFWQKLQAVSYRTYAGKEDADLVLVEAFHQESWQFVRKSCRFRGKEIYQIIATDVTEQESINRELEDRQSRLEAQQNQLQSILEKLEELKKQEARSLMWNHIHDVLGQRISILQRELSCKDKINYHSLESQINNLLQDLNFTEEDNPQQSYEEIVKSFQPLGVNLHCLGELPKEKGLARKMVEIIRESTTNAVRHGQAENIFIRIIKEDGLKMWIENDGKIPQKELSFGGGLRGIEQKLVEFSGRMSISYHPRFTLSIEIPKPKEEKTEFTLEKGEVQ